MRRYLAVCFLLLGPLITTACGGVNSSPSITPPLLTSANTVRVTVINPYTSRPVAGATVTQSLDYNVNTHQPVNVIATQNTDSSGNTTFAIVPNVLNCFSTPITPTFGLTYALDCSVPVPSQVTLNQI